MIELSRLRGSERYAACSDDVMAHRPYGSAQTGMYPFALYCGAGLPTGFLCQGAIQGTTWKGGDGQPPALNQLRSKFRMEIISFVSSRLRISSSTKE